jgi:hypothetical protein
LGRNHHLGMSKKQKTPPSGVSGIGLTRGQIAILEIIHGATANSGVPPSFRKLCQILGVASTNTINCRVKPLRDLRLVTQIERRGLMLTTAGRRAIGVSTVEEKWVMVASGLLDSACKCDWSILGGAPTSTFHGRECPAFLLGEAVAGRFLCPASGRSTSQIIEKRCSECKGDVIEAPGERIADHYLK